MKKYRCPKCGEIFQGEKQVCPKCGVILHYLKKEEPKQEAEAIIVQRFNFDDPDVIKHEDKIAETPLIDNVKDEEVTAKTAPIAKQQQEIVANGDSYFDGGFLSSIGWRLLAFLLFLVTATLGLPWAACIMYRYEVRHTIIQGHRLKFDGKGSQLFGRYLLWLLLTILTLTIFALWIPTYLRKWKTKHMVFAD